MHTTDTSEERDIDKGFSRFKSQWIFDKLNMDYTLQRKNGLPPFATDIHPLRDGGQSDQSHCVSDVVILFVQDPLLTSHI